MENGPTFQPKTTPERLLIIDGHAYAYRAFFAIRSLSSPSGEATNAIYGFIRMLAKAREKTQPTHVIVVWDGGLAEARVNLLPEYKAHRPAMPSDLEKQMDPIVAYLAAAGVYSYCKDCHEADDCIAALARQAETAGMDVVIASSDKDFMQLISPKIKMLNPNEKCDTLHGPEEVRNKTGVEPTQIVDWLSLIGDSVDNIPGVAGVGPKTATDLLRQFGSLNELYVRLAEVKSERLRCNLGSSLDVLKRNQQLVRLDEKTECGIKLEVLSGAARDEEALARLFSGWGFKTLLRELEEARARKTDLFQGAERGSAAA